MKISVIGASQGTGARAVEEALARGHEVTAFARSPQKLTLEHSKLKRVAGDFHSVDSLLPAVAGADAVIVTASVTQLKQFKENPNYFSQGTANVVEAMRKQGVKRLVVLSALGTGESVTLLPWVARKLMVGMLLRPAFEDHVRQESLVRASGLEWVIARPSRLSNGPAKRRYVKTAKLEKVPSVISRADVADFLVSAADGGNWVNQAVQLGG